MMVAVYHAGLVLTLVVILDSSQYMMTQPGPEKSCDCVSKPHSTKQVC